MSDDTMPVSLAEKAYQLLVRKITRLELRPGAVLVEKSLMAELGIGRTPIREALQRLAVEGLVQHLPNRGMLVTDISATEVESIYEFRTVIEGTVARFAALRAAEDDISELQGLHDSLSRATEDSDIDTYVALDRAFHESLARASGNTYLEEAVPRIFNLHLRLWFYISTKSGSWQPVAHSHDEMTEGVVGAVRARDPDRAERLMTSYITRRHQEIKGLL
jgi:DNA-binding GntR family transcriptional regulator